jgi:chromosome partitioning protein
LRKIAIVNQKGGVGKTTTSVNLSAALALLGRRVLLIDMDPQSHATISLGLIPARQARTTYSVLTGQSTPEEAAIQARPNLSLIPSNLNLAGAESELAGEIGRETILKERLAGVSGFDFIFFDSPPSLGLLNVNVLCAAEELFVPIQSEFLSLNGISLLVRTLELIRKRLNPALHVTGVIACMHNPQRLLSREAVEEVGRAFQGRMFQTRVRINVKLAEAPSQGKTIFEYDPESHGARDYLALAREVAGLLPGDAESVLPRAEKRLHVPRRGVSGRFVSSSSKEPGPEAPRRTASPERGPGGRFLPRKTDPTPAPAAPPSPAPARSADGRFQRRATPQG